MKIINLHNDSSPQDCYYILDSNVWLPILGLDESESTHYEIFFSKIIKAETPRILLCPLQLSEILNKLLRYHAHKQYSKKYSSMLLSKPRFDEFYKKEYRCSDDFRKQYEVIMDDFEGYLSHVIIKTVNQEDFQVHTKFDARKLDFNDHHLYLLAKEHNAIMITHDSDFFGLDVTVATFNKKLYNQFKDSVKPTK